MNAMESEQLSVEQLDICFGELDLLNQENRDEQSPLSEICRGFREEREKEGATRRTGQRRGNGRERRLKPLVGSPQLAARGSGNTLQCFSSIAGDERHNESPPLQEKQRISPRDPEVSLLSSSPKQRDGQAVAPRLLLSIDQFNLFEEDTGRTVTAKPQGNKKYDAATSVKSSNYPLPPSLPGQARNRAKSRRLSATQTECTRSYENIAQASSASGSTSPTEIFPALDKPRPWRSVSAPLSPRSLTRKGRKYSSSTVLQGAADSLFPERKPTISPSTSEVNMSGGDAFVLFPERRKAHGKRSFDIDLGTFPTLVNDIKMSLTTKLTEQLETELSLAKGKTSPLKKKAAYALRTPPPQSKDGWESWKLSEGKTPGKESSLNAPVLSRRHLRSSNHNVHTEQDPFDSMFEDRQKNTFAS